MPEDKCFIDTNIIVYAYDSTAGFKHETARTVLGDLWNSGLGVISTQVLQEFFVNVVHKVPEPIDTRQAREIVKDFLSWQVVVNNGESILNAIEIASRYHYSFRDSLIIDAAITGGATVLLSEDFQDSQLIRGVAIQNPFSAD